MRKLLNNKSLLKLIFLLYISLLFIFVILKLYNFSYMFSLRSHILQDRSAGYWNINLIPLKTIKDNLENGLHSLNLIGNTLPFLLLGLLLSMAEKHFKIIKSTIYSILLILCFELTQFITCLGFFDVDDIILNSLFCFIGIIVWSGCRKIHFLNR